MIKIQEIITFMLYSFSHNIQNSIEHSEKNCASSKGKVSIVEFIVYSVMKNFFDILHAITIYKTVLKRKLSSFSNSRSWYKNNPKINWIRILKVEASNFKMSSDLLLYDFFHSNINGNSWISQKQKSHENQEKDWKILL